MQFAQFFQKNAIGGSIKTSCVLLVIISYFWIEQYRHQDSAYRLPMANNGQIGF